MQTIDTRTANNSRNCYRERMAAAARPASRRSRSTHLPTADGSAATATATRSCAPSSPVHRRQPRPVHRRDRRQLRCLGAFAVPLLRRRRRPLPCRDPAATGRRAHLSGARDTRHAVARPRSRRCAPTRRALRGHPERRHRVRLRAAPSTRGGEPPHRSRAVPARPARLAVRHETRRDGRHRRCHSRSPPPTSRRRFEAWRLLRDDQACPQRRLQRRCPTR